jgi:hypothetical protein
MALMLTASAPVQQQRPGVVWRQPPELEMVEAYSVENEAAIRISTSQRLVEPDP